MNVLLWLPGAIALALAAVLLGISPAKEIVVDYPQVIAEERPIAILAFGDMMLDRAVRGAIDAYGPAYPFEHIQHLFAGHDIIVANAEGVFTEHESISAKDHSILRFTFATSSLPTLRGLGFNVLSQANNHGLDFGWDGLAASKEVIQANNIFSFGDPLNKNPGPLYLSVRGEVVAFVGYHQLFDSDASTTLAAITKAREQGAFVIVYPHWGEEYLLGTTSSQTKLAHKFIDAGADVILGAHPHVVEPIEQYNGKAIFYSMGNFVFDQKWNEHVTHGIAVEMFLTKKDVSYNVIPYEIKNMQPTPAGEITSFVLKR